MADGANGSWSQAGTFHNNGTTWIGWFYFANNAATNQLTVTVTPSASVFLTIGCHEHSVVDPTHTSFDGTITTTGSGASLCDLGSCPVQSGGGDIVLGGLAVGGNTTGVPTPTTLFNLENNFYTGSDISGNQLNSLFTVEDSAVGTATDCQLDFGMGGGSPTFVSMQISFSFPYAHTVIHNTHGTYSFTIPAGTNGSIYIVCNGSGGGGGGSCGTPGNGGGGGASVYAVWDAYSVGDVCTIVVGQGGDGGGHCTGMSLTGGNGSTGGASSFLDNNTGTYVASADAGNGGLGANNTCSSCGQGGTGSGNATYVYVYDGGSGQINSGCHGGLGGTGGGGAGGDTCSGASDGDVGADGRVIVMYFTGGSTFDEIGNGGVVCGGAATLNNVGIIAVGGIVCGGASEPTQTKKPPITGGVKVGGAAPIGWIINIRASGGCVVGSGKAQNRIRFTVHSLANIPKALFHVRLVISDQEFVDGGNYYHVTNSQGSMMPTDERDYNNGVLIFVMKADLVAGANTFNFIYGKDN